MRKELLHRFLMDLFYVWGIKPSMNAASIPQPLPPISSWPTSLLFFLCSHVMPSAFSCALCCLCLTFLNKDLHVVWLVCSCRSARLRKPSGSPMDWALLTLEAALMLHAVFIEFFYWIWDFCPADLSEIGWWSAKAFWETRKRKNSTKPTSWSSQTLRLFKTIFKSPSLIWKK